MASAPPAGEDPAPGSGHLLTLIDDHEYNIYFSAMAEESMTTMKAARVHGLGDIRVDEVPAPGEPRPGEAVVAPLWAGICGTDMKEYVGPAGGVPVVPHPRTGAAVPLILGHEFSARVVAVGEGVTTAEVGDEVALMPLDHCGTCSLCLRGEFWLCPDKAWTGISARWGGFGDLALVKGYQLSPLRGASSVAGAVVEPAAVAMNALVRTGLAGGDTVLVTGAGTIGALSVLGALALGASRVFVTDTNPTRTGIAAELGAEPVSESDPAAIVEAIKDSTGGVGVDIALDCAGKPASLDACVHAVRPGGTVGVPAVHPGPATVDVRVITRSSLSYVGSMGYTRRVWEHTLAMVASGRLPVEKW